MTQFLIYDLRVAVLIAVFYLFWRLLLARETLHRLNRVVLLFTAVLSFVLPLCVITIHRSEVLTVAENVAPVLPTATTGTAAAGQPWWTTAAVALFLAGALLTLGHTLASLVRLWRLIRQCELHRQADGTVIAVTERELSPFSWMHYIVMSRSDYDHPDAAIMAHERGHIRARHSWDVMLVGVLSVLQWFNPALWLLRSDLRAIHEFEADDAVLSQGIDARQYQYLLVRKAVAAHGYSVANSLSHSTLKRRINMMLRKKTNSRGWLRALYIVPVVAASLAISARTVTDYRIVGEQVPAPPEATSQTESKAKDSLVVKENDRITIVHPGGVEYDKVTVATTGNGEHPLVLVNGTEMPYDQFVKISPQIIKSISVLKDEDSRKKYGAKAKDGVIVVEIEDHPNKKGHEPFKLKGLVIDEKKEPVVGAIVRVKGTTLGTVTDMEGQYTIEVPDGAIVEVAYVGMATTTFTASKDISETRTKAIVLKKDDSDAAPTAKARSKNETRVVMDGKETSKIVTRVVVDGKEMSMEEFATTTEPEKIESMSVDKTDPSNPVVRITTKKK